MNKLNEGKKQDEKQIKVSFRQLMTFRANAQACIVSKKEETKFKYALEKMMSRTEEWEIKWIGKYNDIELEHALEDEKGAVIFQMEGNRRKYSFGKEDLKKRDKAIDDAFDKKGSVELEPFYCADIPMDLPEGLINVFTPFVIKPKLVN